MEKIKNMENNRKKVILYKLRKDFGQKIVIRIQWNP